MNQYGNYVLILVLLIFVVYGERIKYKKPAYFPTCYRNDPQLNQCLLNATEQIRPYLIKGIPELKLPSFDPFTIPQIKLEQGTGAMQFKASLDNIKVFGLSKYKFSRFDFDVPNYQFFCNATIKNFTMEGDYAVSGRILIAPLEGKGKFTANIDSSKVFVYQKYEEGIGDDGKVHLLPLLTNSTIEVLKPKVYFDGLFDGNAELNAAMNKAINDNADDLFEDLRPMLEHTISRIMEDVLFKSIIQYVPWDELYPVNPNFN